MELLNRETNHGQTDISTQVKNSLASLKDRTPQTIHCKSEAVGLREQIQGTKEQLMIFYNHFHNIGADNQLFTTDGDAEKRKEKNRMVLQKFFQVLVIQNRRFPNDIPVSFVLDKFFEAVVQCKVELKGFNLRSHIQAFHSYMDKYDHQLKSAWFAKQHPEARLKELGSSYEKREEEKQEESLRNKESLIKLYGSMDAVPESLKKYLDD